MKRVVIIGAGHAGIEAAFAASKMGCEAILITIHLETIAQMSCNPCIGGIAKGHLVKEIDALGGIQPRAADATGIHFRVLNRSKGPAVRATRTQNDKILYRNYMKEFLENTENLQVYQSIVSEILIKKGRAAGVRFLEGSEIEADAVILTAGTFLNGKIYIGSTVYNAGRSNEPPSIQLAENIKALGFETRRLKTGTPMRLHFDSIDWSRFIPQPGDEPPVPFSMFTGFKVKNSVVCHIGYTTPDVKKVITDNLHLSPLFSGVIEGIGPRYCPSIEDKIVKFPHRDRHHFFLEPEGVNNKEVYVNGLSSSLPVQVQHKILKAIPGLDKAVMMRPAYAIEYDAISPTQLNHTLESKTIENLFFAGQVNGTSGYEEAAAQGLLAGINAALKLQEKEPFVPGRDEAYMGVLVDDIVSKGVDEPYRLFTSRAEYRMQLREDNAFERLSHYALEFGLLDREIFRREQRRFKRRRKVIEQLKEIKARYKGKTQRLYHLLKMPEIDFAKLEELHGQPLMKRKTLADISYIEANVKYEGYLRVQQKNIKKLQQMEKIQLPKDIDYFAVDGLSTEVRQKLDKKRPANLKEASKTPGVTPASINAISIYLTMRARSRSV
ncbi:MAG: tRNA uridine-5-carboxymethylaminomethyl(34) synthesis enzyme MnmG [Candidatus Aminicenantes bacterium]|nr:tRNA uridine-5-carboxymethylaminomethyl(34) synthesis enzyme MnmG [Candidatus Aminicenantes bacterium]